MTQPIFDGGIFCIMIIISFACMAFYRKIGSVILIVPIISFLIGGLIIITGNDVAFFSTEFPANYTETSTNGSTTTTITFQSIQAGNATDYLIGNGTFPITGTGQLWMGYSLIILACVLGVIFLDQTLKGNLVKGD